MAGRRIEVCGVSVEVETEYAEFARYLEGQFPEEMRAASGAPDVLVRVRWTEGERVESRPGEVFPGWRAETRMARNVFVGDGQIISLAQDDAAQIAIASAAGSPRRFEVRYHFSPGGGGWRETVTRAFRSQRLAALRRSRMSTLTYYAIYYPVWWHLEALGRAHPLHAAGVVVDGRGLLLGGLPGCGKSTLVTSLLGTPGAELLADNIVLHDGGQIFGCFEPLLLDATTRRLLAGRVPLEAAGRRHQYARDAFHAPHRTGGVPLGAALILARGRETRVEQLAAEECGRMLLAVTEAAKEIRRYHVLAALLSLAEPPGLVQFEQRVAHLDRLLAGVPCYWVEVREGAPDEAVTLLRELPGRAKEVAS
jgi:hypothetical protein